MAEDEALEPLGDDEGAMPGEPSPGDYGEPMEPDASSEGAPTADGAVAEDDDVDDVTAWGWADYGDDEAVYELSDEPGTASEGAVPGALARTGGAAAATAAAASQQLREGLEAVRNVRALARQHSTARAQLEELRRELDDAMEILDHRVDIERSYEQIVAEQTAQISATRAEADAAAERRRALGDERDQLQARLAELRTSNEEQLRPYKNLMDTTKGRADDAAVALADARRAVRSAEGVATDATRKRDSRVSAANRAVDNAQERLRHVQTELDKLQGDADAPITALPKMRDELVAERAHLDAARDEVTRVTAETQQAVEEAQARLFSLRQAQESAERVAEDAKREATSSREEYDRLYKQARAAEDELTAQIRERERDMEAADDERMRAEDHIDELQMVLDEAEDIHATPEVTAQLRERITAGQAELERQDQEVKGLAASERELRQTTRTKRVAFFAAIGVAALVVILLIWFVATR